MKKTVKPSRSFDETRRNLLRDPQDAALYLEECLKDGNMEVFMTALKYIAEAQGGVTKLSKRTRLNRETLYRTLSDKGNPRLDTLTKVLSAMGLRIEVVPISAH